MTIRILRAGNTLTVEIPEEMVAQASLHIGEPVEWVANGDGTVSLVPAISGAHRHIQQGLDDLTAGKTIPNDQVIEWLDSWGTENELPAPQ